MGSQIPFPPSVRQGSRPLHASDSMPPTPTPPPMPVFMVLAPLSLSDRTIDIHNGEIPSHPNPKESPPPTQSSPSPGRAEIPIPPPLPMPLPSPPLVRREAWKHGHGSIHLDFSSETEAPPLPHRGMGTILFLEPIHLLTEPHFGHTPTHTLNFAAKCFFAQIICKLRYYYRYMQTVCEPGRTPLRSQGRCPR